MPRRILAALAILAAPSACASRQDAPVEVTSATVELAPVVRPREITPLPPPDLATSARDAGCPLPLPSFAFETGSAMISTQQAFVLHKLALCFNQPSLERTAIVAIGYADPVGAELYNLNLALERAQKVRAFLVANGVAADRVIAASVGSETDRPGRRVELFLTPATVVMPRLIE